MSKAKNYLQAIGENAAQTWLRDKQSKYLKDVPLFVNLVIDATNDTATLNTAQQEFLVRLIDNQLQHGIGLYIQAAAVATWINSCH